MSATMAQATNRPIPGSDILDDSYTSETTFASSLKGYDINPGLDSSFPALSFQSKRFDFYEFTKLEFLWRPTSAITATKGMVILAFDPNPNAREPNDLGEIMAYESVVGESIYKTVRLSVPPHMLRGRRFVRHGPTKDHLTLFDPGMLIIANQGIDAQASLGVIEVHYTVKFSGYHLTGTTDFAPHQLAVLTLDADQTGIVANTATKVELDVLTMGGLGGTLDTTSKRYTPGAGLYKVSGKLGIHETTNGTSTLPSIAMLYKNGAALTTPFTNIGMCSNDTGSAGHDGVNLLGYVECDSDDYLEIWFNNESASSVTTIYESMSFVTIEAVN